MRHLEPAALQETRQRRRALTLWRLLALCSHCRRPLRAWLPRDTLRPLLLGAKELTRDCSSTPPCPFMSRSTWPSLDASDRLWPEHSSAEVPVNIIPVHDAMKAPFPTARNILLT